MSKVLVVVLVVVSGRTITITITITTTHALTALRIPGDSDSAVTHPLVSISPVIFG